ncbi:MAG: HAMP domain-containing sensor histidine kinase [Chloroflexota bacterium]|nr:HAMP domain-containing sensor histidine kinase [Chloroflexota bacterium]
MSLFRAGDKNQYPPEEAALVMRLGVFVTMRWLYIVGAIITTLVASLVFHIGFPTLPVYIICVFMVLYNLVLRRQVRSLKPDNTGSVVQRARNYGNIHIMLDMVTLTVILHFTGGIENPFIFFFVFHIIAASIVLPYRTVYTLATAAILMVTLLVGLEYAGVIPHHNLVGFVLPERYQQISRILAVLVALAFLLYVSTYIITAIAGELRKRQRQVMELREQLLEEKTRELEESSREIAKLAEEKNRFLRFLGVAAHDLKAPLAAIQSYMGVMLGGFSGELNDKQKNMLQRSSIRITELLNLISDLLDIPRIETGQIVQEMKEISLRQAVRNCLQDQRNLAREKGIKLKVEMPETLPRIRGSSPRLQQVITNLMNNALTFTPAEGSVILRVAEKENDIQVEVIDTGIGIPPQDLPRMFEDFFRASNVETKGTGLGLSIARRIVTAHGGKIWAQSPCPDSNCGSKFTFTLPKKMEGR